MYKQSVVTNKGLALIAKTTLGSIVFTKIETGNGTYEEGEDLASRNDLKSVKQSFLISSVKKASDTRVRLRSVISNENLTEGYYINEIGLFATDPDEGEILYSITVAEGNGDYLSEFVSNVYSITLDTYVNVSNASNVTISSTGAYASSEDLAELRGEVEDTKDSIVTFTEASNYESINSGDKHSVILGKIKAFFRNGSFAGTLKVGSSNTVGTEYCFAQGTGSTASGDYSRANGWQAEATALAACADNRGKATGQYSSASNSAIASGNYSHAVNSATASGTGSFAANYSTAGYDYQSTVGKYNENKEENIFEVGNGESESNVSNAFEVKQDGTARSQGDVIANKDSDNPISLKQLKSNIDGLRNAFKVVYEKGIDNLYRIRITKNYITNEVNLHLDVLSNGIPNGSKILDFTTGQYLSGVTDGVAEYTTPESWSDMGVSATWGDVTGIAQFTSGSVGGCVLAISNSVKLQSQSYNEAMLYCHFDTSYTSIDTTSTTSSSTEEASE